MLWEKHVYLCAVCLWDRRRGFWEMNVADRVSVIASVDSLPRAARPISLSDLWFPQTEHECNLCESQTGCQL